MSLDTSVRQAGGVAIVHLSGEIDKSAEAELDAAFADAISDSAPAVLLNFADVRYINSTGIALIVGILARARTSGIEIRACGLTEHYREIFEITRLSDFMSIFADEASGVAPAAP